MPRLWARRNQEGKSLKKTRKTPFWWAAIARARKRYAEGVRGPGPSWNYRASGVFSADEIWKAEKWQTCACGKQDPRIARFWDYIPEDGVLRRSGIAFYRAVRDGRVGAASRFLVAIERRAAELVKRLPATKRK